MSEHDARPVTAPEPLPVEVIRVACRRDRYGEPVEVDPSAEDTIPPAHTPRCRSGWLPDTDDGRAVPCLNCRPHLVHRRDRLARLLGRPTR